VTFETVVVPQPNINGEFLTPADGAKFMASFGIPQIPVRGKAPFFEEWPAKGTTDFAQIDAWYGEYKCNFGSVAKAEPGGVWILETDSAQVKARYKATGKGFTSGFLVRSSAADRGHRYYLQSPESIALGNCSQSDVIGGDFSVRVNNEQCVSPGSISPKTGQQYAYVGMGAPAVATSEEITWLKSQKIGKKKSAIASVQERMPITENRNNTLTSIAGSWRRMNLSEEGIALELHKINQELCKPPLGDDEVDTIAHSVSRYAPADLAPQVLYAGQPSKNGLFTNASNTHSIATLTPEERPEIDTEGYDKPDFPFWVMTGTSLYENLVKPATAGSARHAEFVFMPAMIAVMNYLSGRVSLENEEINMVQFLGLISPPGDYVKSGSCKIAFNYCEAAGLLWAKKPAFNAEGKIVVASVGSSEGFGKEMHGLKAEHAILFYDELGNFANKAAIENSSFSSHLLSMAERGLFENVVKNRKDCFSFAADSYSFSWIWCATTKGFPRHWSKISGLSSGLDDRMVFVLHDGSQKTGKNTKIDLTKAIETRMRIDKAIDSRVFRFEDPETADAMFSGLNGNLRSENRAKAFALFFAVDLGKEEIDGICCERGIALANYAYQLNKYLEPVEADNPEARLECLIVSTLRKHKGMMSRRELKRFMHSDRYGERMWEGSYSRLIRSRLIEWNEKSDSGQVTAMVGIRKHPPND
jgi:hypothetical protein